MSDIEICKTRWPILQQISSELCNKLESFLVLRDEIGVWFIVKENKTQSGSNDDPVNVVGQINKSDEDDDDVREIVYLQSSGSKCCWSYPEEINQFRNHRIVDLRFGGQHLIALSETGQVFVSKIRKIGQLGKRPSEKKIEGSSMITSLIECEDGNGRRVEFSMIRCGVGFNVALTKEVDGDEDTAGKVYCWGRNESGQCGVGHDDQQKTPALVKDLKKLVVTSIDCGDYHTLALTERGQVYAWGFNVNGQLGIGNHEDDEQTWPVMVIIDCCDSPVKAIACGHEHSLLLTAEGRIYGFGLNSSGQVGCGKGPDQIFTPVPVVTPFRFESIYAFGDVSAAICQEDGFCYVWGNLAKPNCATATSTSTTAINATFTSISTDSSTAISATTTTIEQIRRPKKTEFRTVDEALLQESIGINFTPHLIRIKRRRKVVSLKLEPETKTVSERSTILVDCGITSSVQGSSSIVASAIPVPIGSSSSRPISDLSPVSDSSSLSPSSSPSTE